jgi:hypothetical protein
MCDFDTFAGPMGIAGITLEHFDKGAIRITSIVTPSLDRMVLIWTWRESK